MMSEWTEFLSPEAYRGQDGVSSQSYSELDSEL